jgi:hypothetical protein
MMINHKERNCLRNDSAWHHVHATKNHPMLSPIVSPEGAPLDCNHVCPTAICSDWQEQGDNAISSGFNLALRIYSNVPLRHGHCKHSIRRICTEQYGRNRNVTLSKEMYSWIAMLRQDPAVIWNRITAGESQAEQHHFSNIWVVG